MKKEILTALSLTCLFIAVWGYQFGGGDQAEHLPLVLQYLDNSLFKNDFYVSHASLHPTVRAPYVWFIGGLAQYFSLPHLIFALTIFFLFLQFWGWFKLAQRLTQDHHLAFLMVFTTHFVAYYATLGQVQIIYTTLISSVIAKAFIPWVWFAVITARWKWVPLLLITIFWFHPLNGLQQIGMAVLLVMLRNNLTVAIKQTLLWFLWCLIPVVVYYLSIYVNYLDQGHFDEHLYNWVHYHFRNPHHFFLAASGKKAIILFTLLTCIAGLIIKLKRNILPQWLVNCWLVLLALLFANYVMFDLNKYYFIGKLQLYKLSIWFNVLSCWIIILGFAPFLSGIFPRISILYANVIIMIMGFIIMSAISFLQPHLWPNRYQFPWHDGTIKQQFYGLIAKETPKDALFLVNPTDDEFAFYARRAQVIGTKAVIHTPKFMLAWHDRLYEVLQANKIAALKDVSEAFEKNKGSLPANFYPKPQYLVWDRSKGEPNLAVKQIILAMHPYVLYKYEQ